MGRPPRPESASSATCECPIFHALEGSKYPYPAFSMMGGSKPNSCFSTIGSVTTNSRSPCWLGNWYIKSSIKSSRIIRKPRAPSFLSMACFATARKALSVNRNVTCSNSNSRWYWRTSAFLGLVRMATRLFRSRSVNALITGRRPTNSGINPNWMRSQGWACDLIQFGLIPEFVGRLPVMSALTDLDLNSLVAILTKPKNALVRQYQRLFEFEHVTLRFTESALRAVAKQAMERKLGARGLRMILEDLMLDLMYQLPSQQGEREFVVTEPMVEKHELGFEPPIIEKAG